MGQTIIEKILTAHTSEEVAPGRIVWIDLDIRSARDFAGASVVQNLRRHYPNQPVADRSKTFFTFDCNVPANTIPYANNQQICRVFAREQGIKVYDVDAGIGSHVLIDQGLALPGSTVVGTDSHLNIMGAVGCFGQGMGDQDIAFAFRSGRTWFEVPRSIRVELVGRPDPSSSPKDLVLRIMGEVGAAGFLGRSVEFVGPAVDELSLDGRITVASQVTEMGGIIGFIIPDEHVLDYFRRRAPGAELTIHRPDPDAEYERTLRIDVQDLKPQIACPPHPTNVCAVEELDEIPVDSVFIGSCTNGRMEDLRTVARIVQGRQVAEGVMAKIVPATREIYGQALEEGLLRTFFEAGFLVSNPGCGGCASGQIGMTGSGEVQVSTSNRNFRGKQGDGDTYLASPATAAHSALSGRIAPVS